MSLPTTSAATELSALFEPRSVALIGASADPQSISARPLRMLRQHGYAGDVYPINPKYDELLGLRVYPSIGSVPARVDLALVAVPAPVVQPVLEECAVAGVRCALVITSGFAESGSAGDELQRRIADVVARTGLRVCGPNSEGIYNPFNGFCATFSPAVDPEHGFQPDTSGGPIAIVSQSGGLGFALMNHAQDRGLRVGPIVSNGNEVDLTWADYVDYLLDRPEIRVILGFIEAVRQPRRLIQVARKAAQLKKPLVIAKIGRSEAGKRAAASHTGSLVGSDAAYSALFRQLGIQRVDDVDEMLDLAAYFSSGRLPTGRRVAVLTGSGGAGAWLADACATRGLELPPPNPELQNAIRSFIPAYGSVANPVDITAQAVLSGGYERALGLLAQASEFDTLIAVTTLVREERFFQTLPELRQAVDGSRPAVVCYSYTRASPAVISALAELRIACFSTPARTARAIAVAIDYVDFLDRLEEVALLREEPSSLMQGKTSWAEPRGPMSEVAAHQYLAPLEVPSPEGRLARSVDEAVEVFELLGGEPVALKVQSPQLSHKTDAGGVRLGVASSDEVRNAFNAILDGVAAARPEAAIEGVLVQRMAPTGGVEVFVGMRREPLLGPIVAVGLGGLDVEAVNDVSLRVAPVSLAEAHRMLDELRGAGVLRGTRGRAPADIEALASAVVRLSELAAALPASVSSVEINPLLVLPAGHGVMMLDAVVEMGGDDSP